MPIEETKVSQNYQIVIPAKIRKEMGINIGETLAMRCDKGQIILTRKKKPSATSLFGACRGLWPNADDFLREERETW